MSAEAAEDQDQSMEEILQSIKRIIADEEEEGGEPQAAAATETAQVSDEAPSAGSDVLELTEIIQDDGTTVNADDQSNSEIRDSATMPLADQDSSEGLVSDETAGASANAFDALAQQNKPAPKPMPNIESPAFRSGNTVEDLVMEALRPMLKDWLDANLQQIVENIVENEVKRISGNR